mgnify:CR=1 FL=1
MRKNHHGKKDRLVKRVFALCLALAVICTCLVPVFATEGLIDPQVHQEASRPVDDGVASYPDDEFAGFGEEEATRPVDGGEAAGFGEDEVATRPVEGGEDNLDGGPNVKETEWGTVIDYGTSTSTDPSSSTETQWSGEDDVVEKPDDKVVVSGDEIKKLQDMVVYRFWLKELNANDLQDITAQAQINNMTESEYLARNGEVLWNLYFIQAVPRAETIADYSSYIENPSSNRDPKGELRLFDYWYTLDEFGNRVRLNLSDPTSNILDDKTTTVNVYAAWKDGTVGSDEEEDVDHEDLVDKNPVPVDLTAKAAASYEDEDGNTKSVNLPVEVKNLPSAADHLSVIHMGDDDMESFYESHEDSFGEMMPILGLKISPKNAKGEKVQLAKGQKATVTVSDLNKLPEIAAMEEEGALTADALKVLHQKDDNTVEKLDVVSYENGTLTFETSSFSPFVVVRTGGYDEEMPAWAWDYNNKNAAIFILKDPNGNPDAGDRDSWGYAVMGAKVTGPKLWSSYVLGLNNTTYTLTPPSGWKTEKITYNGQQITAWCLPSDVDGYNYKDGGGQIENMWNQILKTYQNNIKDPNGNLITGMTLTRDKIEKIYVIPYKLAPKDDAKTGDKNVTIPGLHIDSQIVVQCKSTYSVNFHITDVGETGSTRVSASTYFIQENANEVTIKENNGRVRESDGAYTNQYNNKIYEKEKTIKGVKYVFDGWYTDSSFDPAFKVKIPDSSSGVRSWSVSTEILSQTGNQLNYYGRYVPVSADLTISKTVTGMLGDTNKAFTFQIVDGEGNAVALTNDNCDGVLLTNGTDGKFTLKHGDTVTIKNLAPGTYKVTEIGVDLTDYETSWKVSTDGAVKANGTDTEASVTMSGTNMMLAFTNHCKLIPDTGVLLDTLPYIVILAVVAGGVALLMLRKHRKEDD